MSGLSGCCDGEVVRAPPGSVRQKAGSAAPGSAQQIEKWHFQRAVFAS
jgi:hypothetical protein